MYMPTPTISVSVSDSPPLVTSDDVTLTITSPDFPRQNIQVKCTQEGIIVETWCDDCADYTPLYSATYGEMTETDE
jgi:hypothetical protein